jgi:uncharacterized protein YbgA (DUF1722 family)/uncharacterized protein YbbK (DUF523 family)
MEMADKEWVKPKVVCSKCIEFEHCRYDGQMISSPFVRQLMPHVDFQTVCPEVEIGLGIPRKRIRIVSREDGDHLMQPETGRDFTSEMSDFAASFLDSISEVDGFILKGASPSCGLKDVKIYPKIEKVAPIGKSSGFFAREVLKRFPGLALEDEGRLRNERIRDHYLTKLFTFARFRAASREGKPRTLVDFHSSNKMLLLAYNQTEMRKMGRIVADAGNKGATAFGEYLEHLKRAMSKGPRARASINVMLHALGHFKEELGHAEKKHLLDLLEEYRAGRIGITAPIALLRSWGIRFEEGYVLDQSFFEPFPPSLMEAKEEKDYWT